MATDRDGRIFVLDSEHDRIQVFSAAGVHLASFGDSSVFTLLGGDPEVGTGISAGGIAVAPGAIYVADAPRDRVVRVPFDAATLTFGTPTFSSVDLAAPQGLALDPAASALYVADDVHDRVVVLDPVTLALRAAVGSRGTGPGQFDAPYDVAVDALGRLYVADNLNARVGVFDAGSLAWLGTFGRSGAGCRRISRSCAPSARSPTIRAAASRSPTPRTTASRPSTRPANALAAWGIPGRGPGYMTRPRGVAFAPGGGITVADTFDDRVESLRRPTAPTRANSAWSRRRRATRSPGRRDGQFSLPQGVAYDAAGQLWVADTGNDRVVAFGPGGVVARTISGLRRPRAVAAGPNGGIVIADTGHDEVVVVDGATLTQHPGFTRPTSVAFDGTDVFVADDTSVRTLDGDVVAPPGGGAWDRPSGLAARPGLLIVSERRPGVPGGARVLRREGATWDTLATEGTGDGEVIEPAGLALNADGNTLLVADAGNNRVLRFDAPGTSPPRPPALTVAVADIARGRVTSNRPGIVCPTDCSQRFGQGSAVTLTATPAAGFAFAGWSGACTGAAPACTVTMADARAVSAAFVPSPPAPPAVAPPPPSVRVTQLRISPRSVRRRARVSLRLSRPATLTVTVQAGRAGRRIGSRCVAPTRALRRRASCTRYVELRGRRMLRGSGTVRFTLTRRFAGRTLKPGRYRLAIVALDAAGNRVGPRTASFTVPRR